jgi:hypothetical protein
LHNHSAYVSQGKKVNELAARHQNYGSLYYNQEGFSGALSKMPTPASMPRMSAEDETLMWEILDFGSSSECNETARLGNLALPRMETMTDIGHRDSNGLSTTQRASQQLENNSRKRPASQSFPNRGSSIFDPISDSIAESPFPSWPFNTRGGDVVAPAIPDIPDWMILGDYMAEHL